MTRGLGRVGIAAFLLVVTAGASAALGAGGSQKATMRLYGKVESYQWKEFDDHDNKLLKESGPLFGFGGTINLPVKSSLHLEGLAEVLFGSVDYDGQTQEGSPVTTTTDYSWLTGEGTISMLFPVAKDVVVKPFAGVGGQAWQRTINDAEDSAGQGYTENWLTIYGILGVGGDFTVNPESHVFADIALHAPMFNQMKTDWSDLGGPSDITVNPGKELSLTAEAGLKWRRYIASVYYEAMDFSKSDAETFGSELTVWQPKSEARMFGVKAGVVF
jgi:hypothetical protein